MKKQKISDKRRHHFLDVFLPFYFQEKRENRDATKNNKGKVTKVA